MREIKFRAWSKAENKMRNWGYLLEIPGWEEYALIYNILNDDDVEHELMQYTGLKDKNGKECYESDIVRFTAVKPKRGTKKLKLPYIDMVVVWSKQKSRFTLVWKADELQYMNLAHALNSDRHEIIGNIYENKELLK